jgi:hypothetical protein
MRPAFPFPVNSTHTGASTDEPQLNMMREMTDGAREIAQFNLPFMDGIHQCIPSLPPGQHVFAGLRPLQNFSVPKPMKAVKFIIINNIN